MITFLPFPDFRKSAQSLDNQRLGKQRAECKQILTGLHFDFLKANLDLAKMFMDDLTPLARPSYMTIHHPASRMWRGYEGSLVRYTLEICEEWKLRGYADTVAHKVRLLPISGDDPFWLGSPELHASHRSNLIRKWPSYYRGTLGWAEPDNLPYWWPS